MSTKRSNPFQNGRLIVAVALVTLSLVGTACSGSADDTQADAAPDFAEAMAAAQGDIDDLTEACMISIGFGGRTPIDEMSPSEGEAYQIALLGSPGEPTIDTLTADEATALVANLETGRFDDRFGCAPQAEFLVQSRIVGTESIDGAVTLEELVGSDPTIVMLVGEWARCMREAGFDVATQNDVEDQISANNEAAAPTEAEVRSDDSVPPPSSNDGDESGISEFEVAIRAADSTCWAPVAERVDARIAELMADQ